MSITRSEDRKSLERKRSYDRKWEKELQRRRWRDEELQSVINTADREEINKLVRESEKRILKAAITYMSEDPNIDFIQEKHWTSFEALQDDFFTYQRYLQSLTTSTPVKS